MSLLSAFFGFKQTLTGPDFNAPDNVNMVLGAYELTYQLPGNLSSTAGFSAKRKQTPPPRSVNYREPAEKNYRTQLWRESLFLDAGWWDYNVNKTKTVGSLNLQIAVNRTSADVKNLPQLADHILSAYQQYFDAINAQTRAEFPGYAEENLRHLLVAVPPRPEAVTLRQPWLHWNVQGEFQDQTAQYYALPLDDHHFVTLCFTYQSVSGPDTQKQHELYQADIRRIAESFVLTSER